MAFWKNGSFVEHVLQEISGACVDTEPRGIEATCIVSGDRERPRASLKNQASDQGQAFHVHVFTQKHLMMELNQGLTKSMPRKYSQLKQVRITYVRTWGIKSCLLEGVPT